MKTKGYFGILIAMLALFSVNQENIATPNQEIVLEFTNTKITSSEAQNAIAIVKKELYNLGVLKTEVVNEKKGTLKIAYYSTIDIESIKKILSAAHNGVANSNFYNTQKEFPFPLNNNASVYNLDVYEILKNTDSESGFHGKHVITPKQEFDRFYNPNLYSFVGLVNKNAVNKLVKVTHKVNKPITVVIDYSSHIIPEVRAGPLS